MKRTALRRLPPISRRDAAIESLQRRVEELRIEKELLEERLGASDESIDRPSFRRLILLERRIGDHAVELGRPWTSVGPLGKLTDYDFAVSHGIDIPVQIGRWEHPTEIPWADLPDLVVIKSAFGSSSRGVFPLRRVEAGWQVVTRDEIVTGEEVSARLLALAERGKERGPYFAEEFLDDGTGTPPNDARIWAFYGEVGFISLKNAEVHGRSAHTRWHFVHPDGTDAIEQHPHLSMDLSIPVPRELDQLIDIATRLSVKLREPCIRVDLYQVHDRLVFGEVTRRPGGKQWHGPDLDLSLGETWERAKARLARDVADGMSPEPDWGPHHVPGADR